MSTADAPERPLPVLEGPPARILLIQAPYYDGVVAGMRVAAEELVRAAGGSMEVIDVAGAFELPAALAMAAAAGLPYDGYLLLGCVVKGDTDHYDHICRETCRGAMDVAVQQRLALGFGLLTVHSLAQAEERAAPGRFNKGAEAAAAVIGQIALKRRWQLG